MHEKKTKEKTIEVSCEIKINENNQITSKVVVANGMKFALVPVESESEFISVGEVQSANKQQSNIICDAFKFAIVGEDILLSKANKNS